MKSYCVEWFAASDDDRPTPDDGMCRRAATHIVLDLTSGTWGPHCARCARFYAPHLIKPMTAAIDQRIADLQSAESTVPLPDGRGLMTEQDKELACLEACVDAPMAPEEHEDWKRMERLVDKGMLERIGPCTSGLQFYALTANGKKAIQ